MATRIPNPDTQKTEQGILNRSYDRDFEVLAFEQLLYDSSSGALVRASADSNGVANVNVGTISGSMTVTATDLDIRNLSSAQDSVAVTDNGASLTVDGTIAATQSGTWTLGANSGVDIGDVTINNTTGAGAVNIQDGGNSITVDGSVTVSGTVTANLSSIGSAATATNQSTMITALQLIDNASVTDNLGFTDGTTGVTMAGYILDETAGAALTENDAAAARVDSKRAQVLVLEDATTRGRRQTVNSDGSASVASQGDVAHDIADSGNPVKIGGKARTTNPTAVANNDRVDATFDDIGRQITQPFQVRDLHVHQNTTISSTTETTVLTAGASGVFHDITQIVLTNTSSTAVRVDIKDSTSGTIRWQMYVPAGDTRGATFSTPLTQATAANNWTATLSGGVTDVRVFIQAVKNV